MKIWEVKFTKAALKDIAEAYEYYEAKQAGLGSKFLTRLQTSFNSIRRNALFASVRYSNVRCAEVKKFPYLIHYRVRNKTAIIAAVFSTHRERRF